MFSHKIIKIDKSDLGHHYDPEIFSVTTYPVKEYYDYKEIAQKLKKQGPYTITVIIDSLNPKFRNNYIIKNELEPRYREKILIEHRNSEKLFVPRIEVNKKRYYNLPYPLNHVDWRNPYDNIFVWEENGKKVFRRGGSGSSGGRETNSKYIFGFSIINKTNPIKSYLFLYGEDNELYFIKEFPLLTIPRYDIGENYHLNSDGEKEILSKTNLLEWDNFVKLREVNVSSSS